MKGWRYLSTGWQFFIAIAGTSLILVALVLLGVRSYFSYNFMSYLEAQERDRMSQVAVVLADYYEQEQTAEDRLGSVRAWRRALQAIQRDVFFNPSKLNMDAQLVFEQLHLETPAGRTVFGQPIADNVAVYIYLANPFGEPHVIGRLSAPKPTGTHGPIDEVFQAQQTSAFVYAGALALLLAAAVASIVSIALRKRLLSLAKVSKSLAQGNYTLKADARGRDDVSALAANMNELAGSLAASEKHRRQLLADVAHELRTPLTVLQGDIEAVQDGIRPADAAHQARLHQQVLHLSRLTNDLYQLSQADLGALVYHWAPCHIASLCATWVDNYQHRASELGLVLTYQVQGENTQLVADADRLQQALTNVLENSLRYTTAPGHVVCTLDMRDAHKVRIRVEDSSPGLTVQQCARLGERLYRPDPARSRSAGGSGLGLSIVQSIVQAHHGQVHFKPSALGGLHVEIELPRNPV